MKCIICGTKLRSLDDTQELWFDGHRIWVCKRPECRMTYIQKAKDPNTNMKDLIYND